MTWSDEQCATCGVNLHPVSLLNSVYVTDIAADGTTYQLRIGRECGCARKFLTPSVVGAYSKATGNLPPARTGDDPKPWLTSTTPPSEESSPDESVNTSSTQPNMKPSSPPSEPPTPKNAKS